MEAIKRVMDKIEEDKQHCVHAPNPDACRQKLNIELNKWKAKYEKHLVKVSKSRGSSFPYFERLKNAKL